MSQIIWYLLIDFIFIIMFFGVKILNNTITKKINNLYSTQLKFQDISDKIKSLLSKYSLSEIKVDKKKYYSYNQKSKTISIKEKEDYYFADLFICFHEVGHCVDFHNNKIRIYNFISIMKILYVILYPILLFIGLFLIVNKTNWSFLYYTYLSFFVIALIIIFFNPIIEYKASQFAKNEINRHIKNIDMYVMLAIFDQMLFQLLSILPIFLIFYFLFYY